MRINVIDIIIVLLLISGFITGYKKGFIKQVVSTVGLIISVVLAFMLKNNLSIILYEKCPFFTVGLLKNYSSLNILLYELLSFLAVFSTVFKIPLKILGGVLGALESYVAIFIILLVLSLPLFSFKFSNYITKSKLSNRILNNTFLISNLAEPLVKTINSVGKLEIQSNVGKKEFNCKTIEIFKKNNIISEESVKYLEKNKKIDKCE